MIASQHILAQRGFNYGDLLYLLIFLVFPALNALGEWVRKRWGKQAKQNSDDGATDFEVVVGANDELVLRPVAHVEPPTSPARPTVVTHQPTRTPHGTTPHAVPQRAERPAPRPPQPARPAPRAPQPARPAPMSPQPQRPQPPQARRAARRPQVAQSVAVDDESHSAFDDAVTVVEVLEDAEHAAQPTSARELLSAEPLDAAGLRRAIILSEILAPPLATRGPSSTPFARPD